jgi:hypothetical protein
VSASGDTVRNLGLLSLTMRFVHALGVGGASGVAAGAANRTGRRRSLDGTGQAIGAVNAGGLEGSSF